MERFFSGAGDACTAWHGRDLITPNSRWRIDLGDDFGMALLIASAKPRLGRTIPTSCLVQVS